MIKGFKDFLMRGNVVDLAVAVVIGAAFSGVIKSVVDGLISPLVGMIFGKPDLDDTLKFNILNGQFRLGLILSQALNFVLVAGVIYFIIIVPMNKLLAMRKRGAEPESEAPAEDVLLLTEIRDLLRAQNYQH